ncbi:MAG TPA: phenylalanine 4-monooxygenase [Alphaproteobacteria bacterium]|nr:phenylalanine 4-monooxygenase [Alphaproteobacteria bacterium]
MFTVATTDHALRGDYSRAAADFSTTQDYAAYAQADHALWRRLYQRQIALMPRYAAQPVKDALAELDFGAAIPDLARVSEKLLRATGWRLVAVPGFIPDAAFFAHLARRQFPVTVWLRKPEEIDYLVEPDIFHDFFGHVPLLFDPVFADFLQLYGEKGAEAERLGATAILARLYWYTVEFGLIRESSDDKTGGIKAYGAGMLSSFAETAFSVDDASPNRIGFDLERVMRTAYRIDDFQQTYFVLESFQQLFRALQQDLRPLYARVRALPDIAPDAVLPADRVFTRGTGAWKRRKAG